MRSTVLCNDERSTGAAEHCEAACRRQHPAGHQVRAPENQGVTHQPMLAHGLRACRQHGHLRPCSNCQPQSALPLSFCTPISGRPAEGSAGLEAAALQAECDAPGPAIQKLQERVYSLHNQIPFRAQTDLAKRVHAAIADGATGFAPPASPGTTGTGGVGAVLPHGARAGGNGPRGSTTKGSEGAPVDSKRVPDDKQGVGMAAIVAPVAVGCALILVGIAAFLRFRQKRRVSKASKAGQEKQATAAGSGNGPQRLQWPAASAAGPGQVNSRALDMEAVEPVDTPTLAAASDAPPRDQSTHGIASTTSLTGMDCGCRLAVLFAAYSCSHVIFLLADFP